MKSSKQSSSDLEKEQPNNPGEMESSGVKLKTTQDFLRLRLQDAAERAEKAGVATILREGAVWAVTFTAMR